MIDQVSFGDTTEGMLAWVTARLASITAVTVWLLIPLLAEKSAILSGLYKAVMVLTPLLRNVKSQDHVPSTRAIMQ